MHISYLELKIVERWSSWLAVDPLSRRSAAQVIIQRAVRSELRPQHHL